MFYLFNQFLLFKLPCPSPISITSDPLHIYYSTWTPYLSYITLNEQYAIKEFHNSGILHEVIQLTKSMAYSYWLVVQKYEK